MFIDFARVRVKGGAGGAGAVAFRRESGGPRGGPAGGNGGRGGDIVLVADGQLSTLLDYSYREAYAAGRAGHGEGSNKTGADELCMQFPTGGGRKAAAGINDLPADMLQEFIDSFAAFYA